MIKCDKGVIEIKGTSVQLLTETVGILKSLIADKVIEPMDVMAIASIVLEDIGFKVVHGTEEDLKRIFEEALDDDDESDDSDSLDDLDDSDDSDGFDEEDIFRFLRGDK